MSKIPVRQCIVSKQSYFRQFYPRMYKSIHLRDFFFSTNILALGFYLLEGKKKVFWKISFILLYFKIKQTKAGSAEVQTNCHSRCPCLVKASTIPLDRLEHLLQTLFIWQSVSGGFFVKCYQESCAMLNF